MSRVTRAGSLLIATEQAITLGYYDSEAKAEHRLGKWNRFTNPKGGKLTSESSAASKTKVPVWVWIVVGVLALGWLGAVSGAGDEPEVTQPEALELAATAEEPALEEQPAKLEAERFEWPAMEPIVLEGSGDDVITLDKPILLAAMDVKANAASRYFGISPLYASGDSGSSLVNTTDPLEGTVLLMGGFEEAVAGFEIRANGAWSFTIKSIAEVPHLAPTETIEGNGDALVRLDETDGLTTISVVGNEDGRYFGVRPHGDSSFSVINTTEPYNGTVRLDSGTLLLEITAIGSWSITLD